MKISVILGHPKRGGFNHAIAATVVPALRTSGHTVAFHDLYQEAFVPVLPDIELPKEAVMPTLIMRHCDEIAAADGIVMVHPNGWVSRRPS